MPHPLKGPFEPHEYIRTDAAQMQASKANQASQTASPFGVQFTLYIFIYIYIYIYNVGYERFVRVGLKQLAHYGYLELPGVAWGNLRAPGTPKEY